VVAAGAALLALAALLLYLYARERSQLLAGAFLRRMGLTRRAEAASLAVEAAALVACAGAVGTFAALVAAAPLLAHLDPFAQLPPAPALVVPWQGIAIVLVSASAFAAAVGAATALLVARNEPAEALRVA
jgi:ABC-type antimicrobial peptide transport system permease subunit